MKSLPSQLTSKIQWRLLPFLLLMYVLSFLDRVNIGFAKHSFQLDTGVSNAAFAFGASIFFIGYALFEVPSNLVLHRVGAKVWMCRIMVTWGIVSAAMMFVHGEVAFYVLRFLLGVTEAGFFPGVILYFTYWLPRIQRGRTMGFFYFGAPLAFIFGSPLSGFLLQFEGLAGFHGWQWLFLIEGLLATLVGLAAYFYLDNKPKDAKWLTQAERDLIAEALQHEENEKNLAGRQTILSLMLRPAVLYLALIYALIQASVYGVVFYLPTQVAGLLGTAVGLKVGFVSAIPWVFAVFATWLIPTYADRTQKRYSIAFFTLLMAAAGMAVSVSSNSPLIGIFALCFAASGFIAVQPIFWTFPPNYLTGAATAGGIALVNSMGSMGGFAAPLAKHWAEATFHSHAAGLYLLATTTLLAGVLMLGLKMNASNNAPS